MHEYCVVHSVRKLLYVKSTGISFKILEKIKTGGEAKIFVILLLQNNLSLIFSLGITMIMTLFVRIDTLPICINHSPGFLRSLVFASPVIFIHIPITYICKFGSSQ